MFHSLQGELEGRPVYHRLEHRVDAPGLTPMGVKEKLASIPRIDMWIPTMDRWHLILPHCTQPEKDLAELLARNCLAVPAQPPLWIIEALCGQDRTERSVDSKGFGQASRG